MDLGYISKNSQQSLKKSQRKLSNYEKMQINIKKQSKSPNGERLFINDILKVNMQHSWKLLERTDSMQTAHKSPINYIAKPNSVESNNYNFVLPKSKSHALSPELQIRRIYSRISNNCSNSQKNNNFSIKNNPGLNFLQLSNGIHISKQSESLFTYYVGPGNNDQLIQKIMKRKKGWVKVHMPGSANFIWTQVKKASVFDTLSIIPRHNKVILDKKLALPLFLPSNEFVAIVPNTTLSLRDIKIYNRLEGNEELCNKKKLFYNMVAFYNSMNKDPFKYIPLSFHISKGTKDPNFIRFISKFNSIQSLLSSDKLLNNCWIIKPGEDTNRGNGISLSSSIVEISLKVNEKIIKRSSERTYIIQKYIYRPLLYHGRKFDIRCYCLVTCINNNIQAYFYRDGYLRTSCQAFSMANIYDKYIHLTNDAIQKSSPVYGQFEDSNKLSYDDFQDYLSKNCSPSINFSEKILPEIKNIVRDSIFATYTKLNPFCRGYTFEILGYDFMIDEFFTPWLIEVNTNPCLELSGRYLKHLIPTMVVHAFNITIDQIFMTEDVNYNQNLFELIFSENK